MHAARVVTRPTQADVDHLIDLSEAWSRARNTSPLSDHLRLALTAAPSADTVEAMIVTLLELSETDDEPHVVAYAVAAVAADGVTCETGVDPAAANSERLTIDALTTLAEAMTAEGSPFQASARQGICWWVDGEVDDDPNEGATAPWSLELDRSLHEMTRPLDGTTPLSTITTRPFVVGADDQAWLRVNNRAFAGHPEQSNWDEHTLQQRLAEPWFDPDGFRLHEIDGELAGFCWTKIHTDRHPAAGEIYVIAVDPAFHGRGLGRQLTLAGLDAITARGVTEAFLFVDGANQTAVGLYRSIGFTIERTRTAYRLIEPT